MLSELFSGSITMDSQGNIVHSNQQSTERKMPVTAKEMFHLTEAHKNDDFMQTIKNIQKKIHRAASEGFLRASWAFSRGYSLLQNVKDDFTAKGFQVSQDTDKDGDDRLWFSWENAKDAQPSA